MTDPKGKIFIIEDEALQALTLSDCLETMGYHVLGTSPSGEMGLNRIAALRPDLVLIDYSLRGEWNGLETAARIHHECDIPVILLSGRDGEELLFEAGPSFISAVLRKPVDLKKLEDSLNSLMKTGE